MFQYDVCKIRIKLFSKITVKIINHIEKNNEPEEI